MIELLGIRKRFGALQVLDGVDLGIRSGRVTAVVGPNSAGKTTLIKSILGLTRIDAGIIRIDGNPVDAAGAYRANVGYMPQIARFPENLTASDLLAMMIDLRRAQPSSAVISGGAGDPRCDESLIDTFGVREQLGKPLRVLSGGTRQKVNAVLAFLFAPATLILDEPTAGLDPVASGILKARLIAERDRGRTVVITSHVLSELDEVAQDVAILVEGKVHFAGAISVLKRVTRQFSLERAVAELLERGIAA